MYTETVYVSAYVSEMSTETILIVSVIPIGLT